MSVFALTSAVDERMMVEKRPVLLSRYGRAGVLSGKGRGGVGGVGRVREWGDEKRWADRKRLFTHHLSPSPIQPNQPIHRFFSSNPIDSPPIPLLPTPPPRVARRAVLSRYGKRSAPPVPPMEGEQENDLLLCRRFQGQLLCTPHNSVHQ
ncbi:unnamed protein product, partial [Mesorhabditis belari]|uniref:Uncharacterized protein n=1 Tax=Mesorhabditis belari TaxID=2138241 RepID=A0AAF3E9F3_9BILA